MFWSLLGWGSFCLFFFFLCFIIYLLFIDQKKKPSSRALFLICRFTLSLFQNPKRVKSRLEKIQRDFQCGGGNLDRKIHLVNLNRLEKLNKSLLGKWNWRLAVEDDPTWKDVIKLKYGLEEGGWFSAKPKGSFGVGLWKDIIREAQQLKQDCKLMLGDGGRIRFWEDKWCGGISRCDQFPKLYAMTASKGAKVGEFLDTTRGE